MTNETEMAKRLTIVFLHFMKYLNEVKGMNLQMKDWLQFCEHTKQEHEKQKQEA